MTMKCFQFKTGACIPKFCCPILAGCKNPFSIGAELSAINWSIVPAYFQDQFPIISDSPNLRGLVRTCCDYFLTVCVKGDSENGAIVPCQRLQSFTCLGI